jgi:RNA polymerase-interacting CarD/CdnL/TRCF family regulator
MGHYKFSVGQPVIYNISGVAAYVEERFEITNMLQMYSIRFFKKDVCINVYPHEIEKCQLTHLDESLFLEKVT